MNAQLFQVFRTYYRRPLIIVMGAIALVLAVGMVHNSLDRSPSGLSIAPGPSVVGNREYFFSRNQKDRIPRRPPEEIDGLYIHEYAKDVPIDLAPYRNVDRLELSCDDLTDQRVDDIAAMASLTSLKLEADTIPPGIWQKLGPKLTRLDIPARLLRDQSADVSQLQRLKVLRLNRDALDETNLAVVARIPNLQTLVLTHEINDTVASPNPQPPTTFAWNPSALAPLRNHPHLKSIFVDWDYPTSRTLSELPGVTLYPASTSRKFINALFMGLFFTAAIAILVALQVWVHFTVQHGAVIPGYHRPHLVVAGAIILGGGLIASLLLWNSQVAWLPALAVSLIIPSITLGILVGTQSSSALIRGLSTFFAMIAGVLMWIPWWIGSQFPTIAGELIWFFQGEHGIWTIAIVLLDAVALTVGLAKLPGIVHQVYERTSLPPGFSPWDPQQQQRTMYGSKRRWQKFWDRREFPSFAAGSLWQKAKLWRLGNAYRPLVFTITLGITYLAIIHGTKLITQTGLGIAPFVYGFGIQFGIMLLIMPVPIWYNRCRQLSHESLRPVGRADLVRQLFAALALDQLYALPILIVATGFVLYSSPEPFPFRPLALLPLPVAVWIWFFSLGTSVFAICRAWVLITYLVTMLLVSISVPITLLIVLSINEVPFADVARFSYVLAAVFLAASAIVCRLTYKRAAAREWGRT